MMSMSRIQRFLAGVILLASMLVMNFAVTPVASAHVLQPKAASASCYGDYCSNTNPYTTGCAANSYRWGYAQLIDPYNGHIGDIELWISNTCATRWARLVLWASGSSADFGVHQSNGYAIQSYGNGAGTYYTYQIYNRNFCSYAWANTGGTSAQTACTVW